MKSLTNIYDGLNTNVKIAEHQEEYQTISAHMFPNGHVCVAMELSDEEIQEIVRTKKVYYSQFATPQLQPFFLTGNEKTFRNHIYLYQNKQEEE